jgi:hypothetical protein
VTWSCSSFCFPDWFYGGGRTGLEWAAAGCRPSFGLLKAATLEQHTDMCKFILPSFKGWVLSAAASLWRRSPPTVSGFISTLFYVLKPSSSPAALALYLKGSGVV